MAGAKKGGSSSSDRGKRLLRSIPKVNEFLGWIESAEDIPVVLIKNAVRETLDEQRQAILAGAPMTAEDLSKETLLQKFRARLDQKLSLNFRTLVNATGVVVHTNLGRSLLPKIAMDRIEQVGSRYSNLEYDLKTGKRGSRYSLVEDLLCELTGAEAALVVNNNAAAVMLVLETLAAGREVIVSRGQLVEIGGSFRIPDVMAKSGAMLVEVGATNRTHLRDYENAITEQTAMLLKVHASNFRIIGFTKEVSAEELVGLGNRYGVPVMEDLGSGCLVDLSRFGLEKEPTVRETINSGVDIVTFSGDKMLGGPQAGLIVGKREIVDRVKKNPMNRALRIDKFTLAGLEAILRLYFDEAKAVSTIPTLAMLTMDYKRIEKRAKRLLRRLGKRLSSLCVVSIARVDSRVGGGALPEQPLASCALCLAPLDRSLNDLERGLRSSATPIIGRLEADHMILDMRTVADDEVAMIASTLCNLFGVEK